MYCFITANGAPPTVETKYEFVHRDGILDLRAGNSSLKNLELRPFIVLTTLCIPN